MSTVSSLPFVRGSDTSESAAASFLGADVQGDERRVLDLLRIAGPVGMTDDAIEVATGLRHQTASARRNGLVRKGLVCDSGERRATRSGRSATVWILGVGTPLEGAPNERSKRPTDEEIAAAESEIGALIGASSWQESAELGKLRVWLRSICS